MRITTMKMKATLTFLIAAALLCSGMAIAQDATETWRDSVDENDVRYLGTVARVMDDSFELRTLEQGTLTFKIPEPRTDAMTLITTGREVQVWVDGGTVTTIEEYGDPTTRTEFDTDATADVDADAEVAADTDAWNDNVDVDADVDADADMDGDEMSARVSADASVDADADARNEFATGGSVAVRTEDDDVDVDADGYATDDEVDTSYDTNASDSDASNDDDRWDGETLPQTASAVPAALSIGALLLIAGLALRRKA